MNHLLIILSLFFSVLHGCFAAEAEESIIATGPYKDEDSYLDERYDRTTKISQEHAIGLMRFAEIRFHDQVSDNCLTNKDSILAKVRGGLERVGVSVVDEQLAFYMPLFPLIRIDALGYRTKSGVCAVSAHMSVRHEGSNAYGKLSSFGVYEVKSDVVVWSKNSIFTSNGSVDKVILGEISEWVDILAADMALARRDAAVTDLLFSWRNLKPVTESELQDQFRSVVKQLAE